MTSPLSPSDLDRVLGACLEALELEGPTAVDSACAAHPDLADALRRRVALLVTANLIDLSEGPDGLPDRVGDFELLERLGSGAMALVLRARQVSTGRDVALKFVRPEQLLFPGARERFRREVELSARLHHPAILPVLAFGEERGLPWFALELVHGASLDRVLDVLRTRFGTADAIDPAALPEIVRECTPAALRVGEAQRPPRSWSRFALEIANAVVTALTHAHAHGVLHRDIKPSNVMLGLDGRVYLTDFGLASAPDTATLTTAGSAVGSVPYMAPETLAGEGSDVRGDVYSAGATLYELLTLHRPFESASPAALVSRILLGTPDTPRRHSRRLSGDHEAVLLRALERDPKRRYPTAAALGEDIQNLLALRPTAARPAGAGARLAQLVRRRPAASTAVALAALLVVGIPTSVAVVQSRARGELARINAQLETALAGERSERERADQNLERATRAVEVMLRETGDALLDEVPLMQRVESTLLARAREVLDELTPSDTSAPRHVLQTCEIELASAVVEYEGGAIEEAQALLDQARARLDERPDCLTSDPQRTRALQVSLLRWLGRLQERRDPLRAQELLTAAVAIELDASQVHAREEQLLARASLQEVLAGQGRREEAVEQLDLALAQLDELGQQLDLDRVRGLRAKLLSRRANQAAIVGNDDAARSDFERAIADLDAIIAGDPEAARAMADAVALRISLAGPLLRTGDAAQALVVLERARVDGERLLAQFPLAQSFRVKQAGLLINLGVVREAQGDTLGCEAAWRAAADQARVLMAETEPTNEALLQAGLAFGNLASNRRAAEAYDEAIDLSHEAQTTLARALALMPGDVLRARALEFALLTRAHSLVALERTDEVREAIEQAAAAAPRDALAQRALVDGWLALSQTVEGDTAKAYVERAFATLEGAVELGWYVPGELEGNPDFEPMWSLPDWPPGIAR
ncbi:serine/threonine protein kinase [Engelhardtia mirabilis]|uniref:Serine/threonine-protein kinase PknB n=1 Tax=Engelhardtia mirabilis TaxID=2528011 RepID=A0A518BMZ2_9BACT|nr:Serine/threonine-protein kinase PknB [Planctomycetes bacterium Pla133]QDV02674.1 Serine/threonine-protein kinase PknB [Planctomycetes bacterium Pla86]